MDPTNQLTTHWESSSNPARATFRGLNCPIHPSTNLDAIRGRRTSVGSGRTDDRQASAMRERERDVSFRYLFWGEGTCCPILLQLKSHGRWDGRRCWVDGFSPEKHGRQPPLVGHGPVGRIWYLRKNKTTKLFISHIIFAYSQWEFQSYLKKKKNHPWKLKFYIFTFWFSIH